MYIYLTKPKYWPYGTIYKAWSLNFNQRKTSIFTKTQSSRHTHPLQRAEKHLPGTGIDQYPPIFHHNGPAGIFCNHTHVVAYQDYRFSSFVQHLHPVQELVQVSPVLPGGGFVQHDGTARGEQKHLGFLDDRMLEMPEDQNIHIHLFCQITQAVRMV